MMIRRIACCTDFSPNSDRAFEAALNLAKQYSAELDIVHVLPPEINPVMGDLSGGFIAGQVARSLLADIEEQMRQSYGGRIPGNINAAMVVLDGHVSSTILKYLKDRAIDLAVVGAYGLSGMGLVIFGSVAKRLTHRADCSVMVVRYRGDDG
jgi:universal stress protein A